MPKVIVAGFGPFPGVRRNPSATLALFLARSRRVARFAAVKAVVLATAYEEAERCLGELLDRERPDAILLFGLAGAVRHLRIETRAMNRASLVFPDARRRKPKPILVRGAAGSLAVRAPTRRLAAAARRSGIAGRLSGNAGSYLCNAMLFHALHRTCAMPGPPLVAFVHIPRPRGNGRRRPKRHERRPTMEQLERAGEQILLQLIAALQGQVSAPAFRLSA